MGESDFECIKCHGGVGKCLQGHTNCYGGRQMCSTDIAYISSFTFDSYDLYCNGKNICNCLYLEHNLKECILKTFLKDINNINNDKFIKVDYFSSTFHLYYINSENEDCYKKITLPDTFYDENDINYDEIITNEFLNKITEENKEYILHFNFDYLKCKYIICNYCFNNTTPPEIEFNDENE
jgi:hypothetical protein